MTQSKNPELESTITVSIDDYVSGEDITINLNDTYGATTTYLAGSTDSYSITTDDTFTFDTSWNINEERLDPKRVERMIKHYPGLEKVWRNFKQLYDMCEQDYEGKIKSGEIDEFDDNIPF